MQCVSNKSACRQTQSQGGELQGGDVFLFQLCAAHGVCNSLHPAALGTAKSASLFSSMTFRSRTDEVN